MEKPKTYLYRGDRFTAPHLKGATCTAVRDARGKCIRGRNGSMLVMFAGAQAPTVIVARLLKGVV